MQKVRFRIVDGESEESVKRFIEDFVQRGSVVVTDGFKSYGFISGLNFIHEQYVMSSRGDDIAGRLESHLAVNQPTS